MKLQSLAEKAVYWMAIALPWLVLGYGIRFSIFGLPTTIFECMLGGFFLLFVIAYRTQGIRSAWNQLPGRWWLLAWVLGSLCAVLWSPLIWKAFGIWRAYIFEPVLVLAVVNQVIKTQIDRNRLRMAFWTIAAFVSVWAIIEFITGKGIPYPWNVSIAAGRRATGPYGYPNAVALFVAPITAYAGARFWILRERLAGAVALVSLLGILVVRSDGGMLAVLVAWALAMMFTKAGRVALGVSALLLIFLAWLEPSLALKAWDGLLFHGWSGKVRLIMWRETWQMLRAHWLLGAGMAGYPVVFDAFHKARFIEIFQYPHQFVLTAWSEGGLLGLLLFLGLLGVFMQRAWHSASKWSIRVIGLAPLIAIVIHGLVDVPYWKNDLAIIFFLLWWLVAWVDEPRVS